MYSPLEWSLLSPQDFADAGGKGLLNRGSIYSLLCKTYPEVDWSRCRPALDPTFWKTVQNQRQFLDFVADYFSLMRKEELMTTAKTEIQRLGGEQLLKMYPNRMEMLRTCYPELLWPNIDSPRQWADSNLHLKFVEYVEKVTGVQKVEDWRKIKRDELIRLGGGPLMRRYGNIYEMLKHVYGNEIVSDVLQVRRRLPPGSRKQKQIIFEYLCDSLAFKNMEDWYSLTKKDMYACGPKFYNILGKPSDFIPQMFPKYKWDFYRFLRSHPFWTSDFGHHMNLMYSMQSYANLRDPTEFTKLNEKDFKQHNGKRCFLHYHSYLHLILSVYPFRKYDILTRAPPVFWKDRSNMETLVFSFLKEFDVRSKFQICILPKGLYKRQPGFKTLLQQHGTWSAVVQILFPRFKWNEDFFDDSDDKEYNTKYLQCFMKHLVSVNPKSKITAMTDYYLDCTQETIPFYFPSFNIAVVYHKEQFYHSEGCAKQLSFEERLKLDEAKRKRYLQHGIRLVIIPFWDPITLKSFRSRLIVAKGGDLDEALSISTRDDFPLPNLSLHDRIR